MQGNWRAKQIHAVDNAETTIAKLYESFNELIDSIDTKMEGLKESKDYDNATTSYYTKKLIREWFNKNGGL